MGFGNVIKTAVGGFIEEAFYAIPFVGDTVSALEYMASPDNLTRFSFDYPSERERQALRKAGIKVIGLEQSATEKISIIGTKNTSWGGSVFYVSVEDEGRARNILNKLGSTYEEGL
jgi:hypothetical protein